MKKKSAANVLAEKVVAKTANKKALMIITSAPHSIMVFWVLLNDFGIGRSFKVESFRFAVFLERL
jgi:hypothetical protein